MLKSSAVPLFSLHQSIAQRFLHRETSQQVNWYRVRAYRAVTDFVGHIRRDLEGGALLAAGSEATRVGIFEGNGMGPGTGTPGGTGTKERAAILISPDNRRGLTI